jgi:hypothetical protein
MRSKAKDVGLNTLYQVTDKAETGKCAVLITNNERSLVAHLGAANNFTVEHLDCPKVWSYVTKAKIFYISVRSNLIESTRLFGTNLHLFTFRKGLLLYCLSRSDQTSRRVFA